MDTWSTSSISSPRGSTSARTSDRPGRSVAASAPRVPLWATSTPSAHSR
ncbi:hypothetical protein [Desulfocurvus sp.]|nr:hypothetical protein [Desulfocurvus sp.]MCK9240948.1 hypothetical protein [Desulfocurvus sp.]